MNTHAKAVINIPSPRYPIRQGLAAVVENRPVNAEYRLLVAKAEPAMLACAPGQFFHLRCPVDGHPSPFFRRPMSIYGFDRARGALSFLYKVTGLGTRALAGLRPGDDLDLVGPLGRGFDMAHHSRHPLLLARGVGLATLAPLAEALSRSSAKVTAICSARAPELLMSLDRFRSWGVNVIAVSDSEGNSAVESIKATIENLIETEGVDRFYTCGSARLIGVMQRLGRSHGISGEAALEQHMACGVGACQACVRPFRRDGVGVNLRVCHEGPVFGLEEIV